MSATRQAAPADSAKIGRAEKACLTCQRLGVKDIIAGRPGRAAVRSLWPTPAGSTGERADRDRQRHWVVVTGFDKRIMDLCDLGADRRDHRVVAGRVLATISGKAPECIAGYDRTPLAAAPILHGGRIAA